MLATIVGCEPAIPPELPAPGPVADEATLREVLSRHGLSAGSLRMLLEREGRKVYAIETDGARAVEVWKRLRGLLGETGRWPVILGEGGFDMFEEAAPIEEVLAKAERVRPFDSLRAEEPRGPWPEDDESSTDFLTPFEILTGRPRESVSVALMPTPNGWEVPAILGYGGWNACPPPEIHVALLNQWHARFGAELACIDRDVIELHVARPPASREEALRVAREQYLYCPDIVDQGAGTVDALAATLKGGTAWYFWWD